MYVSSTTIENLRTVVEQRLDLQIPGSDGDCSNFTLLLGNNGAGKTTFLRAIALGVLAPVIGGSGYAPFSLVRRSGARGAPRDARVGAQLRLHPRQDADRPVVRRTHLTIKATAGYTDRFAPTTFPSWAKSMYDDASPAFLLVGYGASRRVESEGSSDPVRSKQRLLRYQRVAGLFEEHVNLVPLASWLPTLRRSNPGRHKQVIGLVNQLMFEGELVATPDKDGRYRFKFGGSEVPFAALSDGYRSYVGWIADLLYHVCMGCPPGKKLVDNRGVVLIDEIDLHLHPQWQQVVIGRLSLALPNLQFVATSHSPLLVGSIPSQNIRALVTHHHPKTNVATTRIETVGEELRGRSADQILTNEVFGLESTRAPEFRARLERASAKARGGDAAAARRLLEMLTLGEGAA